MGIETIATIALIGAAAGGVAAATGAFDQPKPPTPEPLPPAPDQEAAAEKAQAEEIARRKKRIAKASTILTSPQGVLGEAPVAKKTLLGD